MGNAIERIIELTDLPNYKDIFTNPLAELGVTTIDELVLVLKDEERTGTLISAVKGLGPKTIQCWKGALLETDQPDDGCSMEVSGEPSSEETSAEETVIEETVTPETVENSEEDIIEPATEEEPEQPLTEEIVISERPREERNLFCTMEELNEIQRTTTELLKMNGSKKKGQVASVEYARKRLMEAGLDVKINRELGFPTIVASKGEGGVLLWGHLDTERMKGMKRKEQGQILGDMIRGRGAANMKGAVAAMICAAKRLSTWQVPFTIVLTTDALVEQRGAESLALDPLVVNSKGILILAPTSMTPIIGQIGYAAVKVRTNGEGAVMNMADFLKKLAIHIEESSGRLSVKTGSINGGKKKRPFESPGSCDVTLELKTVDEIDLTMDEIEGLMEGMEHEIDVLCQSEMMEFDRSSEIAKEMTELSKKEPVLELIHSEASEIVSGNQKITIWGPGNMATAVTDQEYVTLSELERTYEGILNLIDRTSPLED